MDTRALERLVAREAGLTVGVEEREGRIHLLGLVGSAEERQAAEDVVAAAAPDVPIENEIEVETFGISPDPTAPIEAAVDHTEE